MAARVLSPGTVAATSRRPRLKLRSARIGTDSGVDPRSVRGWVSPSGVDYLTSSFITSVRPMVMGMISQIVAVKAR